MQSVVSVMTAGMNGILIAFSQTAVNVLGVYFKLQTFVFMPVFGLNQGALPVMGYNYGARNRKRLMGAYKITLTAAVVIMALGLVPVSYTHLAPEKYRTAPQDFNMPPSFIPHFQMKNPQTGTSADFSISNLLKRNRLYQLSAIARIK